MRVRVGVWVTVRVWVRVRLRIGIDLSFEPQRHFFKEHPPSWMGLGLELGIGIGKDIGIGILVTGHWSLHPGRQLIVGNSLREYASQPGNPGLGKGKAGLSHRTAAACPRHFAAKVAGMGASRKHTHYNTAPFVEKSTKCSVNAAQASRLSTIVSHCPRANEYV